MRTFGPLRKFSATQNDLEPAQSRSLTESPRTRCSVPAGSPRSQCSAGSEAEGTPGAADFADEHLGWLEGALGGDTFSRVTWPRVVDAATTLVAVALEEERTPPLWPHAVLPLPHLAGRVH